MNLRQGDIPYYCMIVKIIIQGLNSLSFNYLIKLLYNQHNVLAFQDYQRMLF